MKALKEFKAMQAAYEEYKVAQQIKVTYGINNSLVVKPIPIDLEAHIKEKLDAVLFEEEKIAREQFEDALRKYVEAANEAPTENED